MQHLFLRISALALAAVLAGCASPANPQNMSLRSAEATELRARSPEWSRSALEVKDVTGGKETNPAWTSQVSSTDFRSAIEDSLKSVGMYAVPGKARFDLVVHLARVDQPLFGASMTVTVSVVYQLIDRASRKTVWEKTLTTPYTAAWNDAFAGTERLRLANEGSIRANVTELVKQLQGLNATQVAPQ